MLERFAIYYAPAVTDPLWARANAWYARPENQAITASARRYGFHATIKPPFELAAKATRGQLETKLAAFASAHPSVAVGRLVLRSIGGGFLALVPEEQSRQVTDFAGDCVVAFEPFRAALTAVDRARRLPGLSMRQIDLLDRYGYPYVMEQFRFHMTLADRLPSEDAASVMAAARAWFAPHIGQDLMLDRLVLFHEPEPGAPFVRLQDHLLLGRA